MIGVNGIAPFLPLPLLLPLGGKERPKEKEQRLPPLDGIEERRLN